MIPVSHKEKAFFHWEHLDVPCWKHWRALVCWELNVSPSATHTLIVLRIICSLKRYSFTIMNIKNEDLNAKLYVIFVVCYFLSFSSKEEEKVISGLHAVPVHLIRGSAHGVGEIERFHVAWAWAKRLWQPLRVLDFKKASYYFLVLESGINWEG